MNRLFRAMLSFLRPLIRRAAVFCLGLTVFSGCALWSTGTNWHRLIFLGRPLDSAQSGLMISPAISAPLIKAPCRRRFTQIYETTASRLGLVDVSQSISQPSHIIRKFRAPGREFYAELCQRAEGQQLYVHLWEGWSPTGRSSIGRTVEREMIGQFKKTFDQETSQ